MRAPKHLWNERLREPPVLVIECKARATFSRICERSAPSAYRPSQADRLGVRSRPSQKTSLASQLLCCPAEQELRLPALGLTWNARFDRWRRGCGWNFARRSVRKTDGIGSGYEVNWLIDGRCGEGLPAIDLAHVDLAGSKQRPEVGGRRVKVKSRSPASSKLSATAAHS
jgi:hypothetical protein